MPIESGAVTSPQNAKASPSRGEAMRLMNLCYAALGFAIARWVFHRQAVAVVDPVTRFRMSGLL